MPSQPEAAGRHAGARLGQALLGGLLCLAAPPGAAVEPADLLDRCVPRLDAARDVGVARILRRCPELERAWDLDASPYGLPQDWRDVGGEMSRDSLRELARLLRDAAAPPASAPDGAAPRAATLAAVLQEWPLPDEAGVLQRLLRWVRSRMGGDGMTPTKAPEPTPRIAGERAPLWWRIAGWTGFAALLALVGWVGWREAQAAGWLRRLQGVRGLESEPRGGSVTADAALPQSVGAAVQSPAWWLEQVALQLAARRRLPHPAGATPTEIAAAMRADTTLQPRLALLVAVVDAARYARDPPSSADIEAAVAAGGALLERLR